MLAVIWEQPKCAQAQSHISKKLLSCLLAVIIAGLKALKLSLEGINFFNFLLKIDIYFYIKNQSRIKPKGRKITLNVSTVNDLKRDCFKVRKFAFIEKEYLEL